MSDDPAAREWIIQRCTQKWSGTELIYEDWPPGAANDLMTRAEMITALDQNNEQRPGDEFRGHNVANCRCPQHEFQGQAMKHKHKALTPGEWQQALFAPTAEDKLRAALEAKDQISRSWADLLAKSMAWICRARKFAISAALDWIDATDEPADIFEFSELTRGRHKVVSIEARKAVVSISRSAAG